MAITDLIAQGGTGIPTPVDRYLQARGTVERLRQNKLAEQAQRQTMALNQRKMQMAEQQQMQESGLKYAAYIAPLLKQISDLPEDQQQAAYSQVVPQLKQSAADMGLPAENVSSQWDGKKADMIVKNFYKAPKGSFVNAELNGKIIPAIETEEGVLIDPETRNPLVGAIKAPTRQATGTLEDVTLTGSQAGKVKQTRIEAQANLEKHIGGINYIKKIINSPDFVGGTAGDIISTANSVAAQFRQAAGVDPIIKGNMVDSTQIAEDSKEMNRFRKSAIKKDSYDAAMIELAYVKAKAVDPAAKITDKDFAFAKKMLGTGADKASLLNTLNNEIQRSIQAFNQEEKVYGERLKDEGYKPSYYNLEQPSTPKVNDAKSAADKWLEESGF